MRTAIRSLAVLCVVLVTSSTALWAQRPQTREGFWIGFGFGYGSFDVSCDDCPDIDREGSATGFIKLGGTLSPKLLLGGEVTAWVKSESGYDMVAGNVSAVLYFYPVVTSGLFLKGGLGYSNYRESNEFDGSFNGFGVVAGIGYDIRVGGNISITPNLDFAFGGGGDLDVDGLGELTGWTQNLFQLALGVTFH